MWSVGRPLGRAGIMWNILSAWMFLRNDPVTGGGGAGGAGATPSDEVDCPKMCFCNIASKIVYCSRRGLSSIPDGIPLDSLQLNLNGNLMRSPIIRRSNVSHLAALEHLYLSECSIEGIEVGAFGNLPNLRWLDLSNNQIKVIHDDTFQGLSLQHLFLNGNRNLQLLPGSFEGLETMGLYLHDCSLTRLRSEVLIPLENSLKNLWLNGNELERFDRRFEEIFSRLQHLRLGMNPLQCSCDAVWLKDFFDRSSEIFRGSVPPSCLTPRQLKGRYFNDLSLFDLRCQMPQFTGIDGYFETDSGRLRCAASGEPAPVLYWIQPSGKTSKFLPPTDEDDSAQNEAVLTLAVVDGDKSHLSGMYICVANNEAGNVTLSLTVPWPPNPFTPAVLVTPGSPPVSRLTVPPLLATQTPLSREAVSVAEMPVSVDMQSRLLGDSLLRHQRSTPPSSEGSRINYTRLDVQIQTAAGRQDVQRMFTVAEVTWAVVGTHLLTLLLCVTVAVVCHRRRREKARKMKSMDYCNDEVIVYDKAAGNQAAQIDGDDPSMSESVYLNSLRHHRLKYYMDPRPQSAEHTMIMR